MAVAEATDRKIEDFIARWAASEGAERANFQPFALELCDVLGVERPHASVSDAERNPYAFERSVEFRTTEGIRSLGRIDLYRKGSFVLEAKQSRAREGKKPLPESLQPDLLLPDTMPRGQRTASRNWDVLMMNAKRQAEEYARALPVSDGWPPFVLVCDVGHCIEVYADFSGQGKNYTQFPDRQGYRVYLEDLRHEEARARLKRIWLDPQSLDPSRQSAKVTREIAKRLAEVSKGLEARGHDAEHVALFLMRCLFTMFAEDVELLPKESFKTLLDDATREPKQFVPMVEQLWTAMDKGEFAFGIRQQVRRFNGKLFKSAKALQLEKHEIGELAVAAKFDWREVEPAIFGTLLEQALSPKERAKLGAHYTPRAYVERLVVVTVMEPLRQEWVQVQATAERLQMAGEHKDAIKVVGTFHEKLCATRVLDPACGTGNFLYVSMELMKRLEGEVLEALVDLGGQEALALDRLTVDPHQFLGLELNARAAAIAELVIWLGYLQWHFRTRGAAPAEPILKDFKNINFGRAGGYDAVLTWEGYPVPRVEMKDGQRVETYPNARRPDWPEAEFIVGNPPFIGKGELMREALGQPYLDALVAAYPQIKGSADFVMYWWHVAATQLVAKGTTLRRFGLVTTNSIKQVFNRRVVAQHLRGHPPVSLLMAIADHPWSKVSETAAAVRIAMTVVVSGAADGVLRVVRSEKDLDSDQPTIHFETRFGRINEDLTIGANLAEVPPLRSNEGLASMGPALGGRGFIIQPNERALYAPHGSDWRSLRVLTTGKDITGRHRKRLVIDVRRFETEDELRRSEPRLYQRLRESVYGSRQANNDPKLRRYWWRYRRSNEIYFEAVKGLRRYIATVETTKHRVFIFVGGDELVEHGVIGFGLEQGEWLGFLSSRPHVVWTLASGGTLEDRPRYNKDLCFDPFPFPVCADELKNRIGAVAEELDAHRKARQAEHPHLTLTQMYNVLEKLRTAEPLDDDDERIKREGLVLILRELHDKLDALVLEAYGWTDNPSDDVILERLVRLNAERKAEEARGLVRWLRPDYQIPRFGSDAERTRLEDERRRERAEVRGGQSTLDLDDGLQEMKPKFPTGDELAETAAVMRVLAVTPAPITIPDIARHFSQGRQIEKRVGLTIMALARLGHIAMPTADAFMLRQQRPD